MTIKHGPGGIGKIGKLGQSDLVSQIAAAIQRQEGFAPGTVAYRNNNPGNLKPIPGGWPGQTGVDSGGYAVFDSLASGTAALDTQIQTNINRGLTLQQFFAGQRDANGNVIPGGYPGYAPAADSNQPNVYTANVASWTGIDPNVPLISLVSPSSSDVMTVSDTTDTTDTSGTDSGTSTLAMVGIAAGIALLFLFVSHR